MKAARGASDSRSLERNRARFERGVQAEALAGRYLEAIGMQVLARNLRVGRVEIDILARDGDAAVVVEVRTRGAGSWQGALASVDGRKQARLRRAASLLWASKLSAVRGLERMRFDVIAVDVARTGAEAIEHVRAAF